MFDRSIKLATSRLVLRALKEDDKVMFFLKKAAGNRNSSM